MNPTFDHPMRLTLLAALPVLAALAWHAGGWRRRVLSDLGDPAPIGRRRARTLLGWLLVSVLLIVAVAGPRWGAGPPLATKPGCDAVLVLDLSRSMLAQDALPNRLERGKAALKDLIDEVQARGGHRLGVVAFAGQSQIICPLTHDYKHVRTKIAGLSADPLPRALNATGTSGTRIGAGLDKAVSVHDPQFRGAQMIILVSDGDDPANDGEWRMGIAAARSAGIPVSTIGIGDTVNESLIPFHDASLEFRGTPVRTRLHETPLREIAVKTGGEFISGGVTPPEMGSFVRETMNRRTSREAVGGMLPSASPQQMVFLIPALLLAILLMLPRLSWQPRLAIAGAAVLLVAAAAVSNRELQRGIAALDAGQFEKALTHFAAAGERPTDPGLVAFNEGVALYHLRRFREAEQRFRWALSDAAGSRRASALYNLGCALLQQSQGRLAEPLRLAVAALEQSLAVEEIDADVRNQAQENLALAKRLLGKVTPDSSKGDDTSSEPTANRPSEKSIREATNPEQGKAGSSEVNVAQEGKADAGKPQPTDRPPPPGKGNLPPLADDDALSPLTADDARAHLERATARIAAARNAQLRSQAASPATQFPDW